jgi:hypothetical protein
MNLNNKLKGLPTIHYFNLDNRTDRRDWIESQFDYWKIQNFHRVSGSKYLGSKHNEWKDIYIESPYYRPIPPVIGNLITVLESIKNWLESTNDPYLILMEDDHDLSLIEYWHFDWDYLMNNIPYDWDCIQFGTTSFTFQRFFLHPKMRHSYYGPCMINRHYAEKLIKIHTQGTKYKIYNKVSDFDFISSLSPHFFPGSATVDYAITKPGRTYCIPIISVNLDFGSFEDHQQIEYPDVTQAVEAMKEWWVNDRDKFTLGDFFTYGKPYDHLMMKYVPTYPSPLGIT